MAIISHIVIRHSAPHPSRHSLEGYNLPEAAMVADMPKAAGGGGCG